MDFKHVFWDLIKIKGQITASITHELKNCLAIIQEKSGLLEDLLEISQEKNVPINQDKIKEITNSIYKQTLRANEIIKNLNKIAHTPDEECLSIDISSFVNLAISTYKRIADMKNIVLEIKEEKNFQYSTQPFVFYGFIISLLNDFLKDEKRVSDKLKFIVKNKKIQINPIINLGPVSKQIAHTLNLNLTKENNYLLITF